MAASDDHSIVPLFSLIHSTPPPRATSTLLLDRVVAVLKFVVMFSIKIRRAVFLLAVIVSDTSLGEEVRDVWHHDLGVATIRFVL